MCMHAVWSYRQDGAAVHTVTLTAGSLLANCNKTRESLLLYRVGFAPG